MKKMIFRSSEITVSLICACYLAFLFPYGSSAESDRQKNEIEQLRSESIEFINLVPADIRSLSEDDLHFANIAWRYFEKNTRNETGFVDSVSGFPSTTMWDQGSYVLGLLSAYQLGLISETDFDHRVVKFLESLDDLAVFDNILPNKAYNTITLEMSDYQNNSVSGGIGWSAVDIGRLLSALRALQSMFPKYSSMISGIAAGWRVSDVVHDGVLVGISFDGAEPLLLQEGRIGYEQYAASGLALWGLNASYAMSPDKFVQWEFFEDVWVPTDIRTHATHEAITPITGEPFFLYGLEFGLDGEMLELSKDIFLAQMDRFDRTQQMTMVSEDHLDRAPYFAYNSVFANGQHWEVTTESGESVNDLRSQSSKATFAWDAIFENEYTSQGMQLIAAIGDEDAGWPAGIYEANGDVNAVYTLNTNAIILQSIFYKKFGPIHRFVPEASIDP